jgi:hypothetical protein
MVRDYLSGRPVRLNGSNGSSTDLTRSLQHILRRLDLLEDSRTDQKTDQRDLCRGDQSRVEFSSEAQHQSSPPPRPSATRVISENPDFTLLVRVLFQFPQVAHHLFNWADCPQSLSDQIDSLIHRIKPPLSTPNLKLELEGAVTDFKHRVTSIVQQHLDDTAYSIMRRATDINALDIDYARDIAIRQLHRRFGKRLHRAAAMDALNELTSMLKQPKTMPPRRALRQEDLDWVTEAPQPNEPTVSTTMSAFRAPQPEDLDWVSEIPRSSGLPDAVATKPTAPSSVTVICAPVLEKDVVSLISTSETGPTAPSNHQGPLLRSGRQLPAQPRQVTKSRPLRGKARDNVLPSRTLSPSSALSTSSGSLFPATTRTRTLLTSTIAPASVPLSRQPASVVDGPLDSSWETVDSLDQFLRRPSLKTDILSYLQ